MLNKIASAGLALCALLGTTLTYGQTTTGEQLNAMVAKVAPSIVTVRVVIQTEAMGQSQESRVDLQGTVVDASGLIMIANSPITADRLRGALGGALPPGFDLKITPSEFKVVVGNEEKEHEAFMVAKDTKLDLAFIKISNMEGVTLTPLKMDEAPAPAVGSEVICISRMKKGFDFAPYFKTTRINGKIKKPRKAMMTEDSLDGMGLPAFNSAGQVIGVFITLSAGDDMDGGGANPMSMLLGGGVAGNVGLFILPAKVASRTIDQARQKAMDMAAEQKKDADADAAAPAGGAAGGGGGR